jgi:hypothetical protein
MESKEERAVQTSRQRASAARKEFQVTTERVGSASKKRRAASAADERREGAVVLADEFVSGGHNRSSGHGAARRCATAAVRLGGHLRIRKGPAIWAWFNPCLVGSELPRHKGP